MKDCGRGYDECECDCHTSERVSHFMACCRVCAYCRKNITKSLYELHVADCKEMCGME